MPASGFEASSARRAMFAFYLSGLFMSLPGAILPAWGYHLRDDFAEIGLFFLSMWVGLLPSARVAARILRSGVLHVVLAAGSGVGAVALVELAFSGPPLAWPVRLPGFVLLGLGAGVLNSAAFRSIAGAFERDAASAVNLAGVFFVSGCLTMAVFVASTFYVYTVASALTLAALIPGFAAIRELRRPFGATAPAAEQDWRQVWRDARSPAALLFSLLLFLQFGNEWTVAGWLAVLLVRRAGMSPDDAMVALAAYWVALLVGRIGAQTLLRHAGHGRLLLSSASAAMLGCLILMATDNRLGAWGGVLLLGLGFATIYPLVAEKAGGRFPGYHPGLFNGLLSIAVTGGLLAPGLAGLAAQYFGLWVAMAIPMAGTAAVLVLAILLWVEARLSA